MGSEFGFGVRASPRFHRLVSRIALVDVLASAVNSFSLSSGFLLRFVIPFLKVICGGWRHSWCFFFQFPSGLLIIIPANQPDVFCSLLLTAVIARGEVIPYLADHPPQSIKAVVDLQIASPYRELEGIVKSSISCGMLSRLECE